jgi:hypothetical protein
VRSFSTVAEASVWLLTGPTSYPAQGDVQILCGSASVWLYGAVLSACSGWWQEGITVHQSFELQGGIPETDAPAELISDSTTTMILAGTISLTTGAESVALSWTTQAAPPTSLVVTYTKPAAGGANIWASVLADTLASDGATVELSAPAAAGSKLAWTALWQ